MAWTEPIYDRTQQDVVRVKELLIKIKKGIASEEDILEYNTDLKGALNTSDLQRIVGNIQYLADLLEVSITQQSVPEIPRYNWYNQLLINLQKVLNAYTKYSDTPDVPNHPLNTYEKWNTIEKIIWDIQDIYKNNIPYYAGEEMFMNNNVII